MTAVNSIMDSISTGNVAASVPTAENESSITKTFSNFMNGFNRNVYSNANDIAEKTQKSNTVNDSDAAYRYNESKTFSSVNADKVSANTNDAKTELSEEDMSTVEEYDEKVKKLLEEKLGVSEEDIVNAMEKLGLGVADLADQANLINLTKELTGVSDISELLTTEGVGDALKGVESLLEDLSAELNLKPEELTDFSAEIKEFTGINAEKETQETVEYSKDQFSNQPIDGQVKTEAAEEGFGTDPKMQNIEVKAEENLIPNDEVNTQNIAETAQAVEVSDADTNNLVLDKNTKIKADQNGIASQEQTLKTDGEPKENTVISSGDSAQAAETEEADKKSFEQNSNEETDDEGSAVNTGEEQNSRVMDIGNNNRSDFQSTLEENVSIEEPIAEPYIDTEDIISQIVTQTRVTNTEELSSVEMQLNPENLGKILLQVTEKEGQIKAQITASNEAVKEALQNQMAELKVNMNAQGIKVDSVEVTVSSHAFEENLEQNFSNNNEEQNANEHAAANTRRVINLNDIVDDSELTEDEALVANIMRDNGNRVYMQA